MAKMKKTELRFAPIHPGEILKDRKINHYLEY